MPSLGSAQGLSGSYLAGELATRENNYAASSQYYVRAMAQDPKNTALMERAAISFVSAGELQRAKPIVRLMQDRGLATDLTRLMDLAFLMKAGEYDKVLDVIETIEVSPFERALGAWALVGQGKPNAALDVLADLEKLNGMRGFSQYHTALIRAYVGDLEMAADMLAKDGITILPMSRRTLITHATILAELERHSDALAVLDYGFAARTDPSLSALYARIAAGAPFAFDQIQNVYQGAAEVLHFVSSNYKDNSDDEVLLIYARLADELAPGNVDALLDTADYLERLQNYDLAIKIYEKIPVDHEAYVRATIGRAEALQAAEKPEEALDVLGQLSATYPDLALSWTIQGHILSRQKKYAEARAMYDRSIDLTPTPSQIHWHLFFSRGVTNERLGDWEKAEADFKMSLALNPKEARVLNYLGYSLLERKERLDEALVYIQDAVRAEPDSGYIVDSLGWAYFRTGEYDKALVQMERAVNLLATDGIVTDHLGDVYWAVGRITEAQFQWRRALSFGLETEEDEDRIRRKIELGLDQVLADEGSAPLKVQN